MPDDTPSVTDTTKIPSGTQLKKARLLDGRFPNGFMMVSKSILTYQLPPSIGWAYTVMRRHHLPDTDGFIATQQEVADVIGCHLNSLVNSYLPKLISEDLVNTVQTRAKNGGKGRLMYQVRDAWEQPDFWKSFRAPMTGQFPIEVSVIDNRELAPQTAWLYLVLLAHSNWGDGGVAFPHIKRLAVLCDYKDHRSLYRHIYELVDKGYMDQHVAKFAGTVYEFRPVPRRREPPDFDHKLPDYGPPQKAGHQIPQKAGHQILQKPIHGSIPQKPGHGTSQKPGHLKDSLKGRRGQKLLVFDDEKSCKDEKRYTNLSLSSRDTAIERDAKGEHLSENLPTASLSLGVDLASNFGVDGEQGQLLEFEVRHDHRPDEGNTPEPPPSSAIPPSDAWTKFWWRLGGICGLDLLIERNCGKTRKFASELWQAGYRIEHLDVFKKHVVPHDWRWGLKHPPENPRLDEVVTFIHKVWDHIEVQHHIDGIVPDRPKRG